MGYHYASELLDHLKIRHPQRKNAKARPKCSSDQLPGHVDNRLHSANPRAVEH